MKKGLVKGVIEDKMPFTIDDKFIPLQSGVRISVESIETLKEGYRGHGFLQVDQPLGGYNKGEPIDIIYNEKGIFIEFREM